jgi:hypothetical protein
MTLVRDIVLISVLACPSWLRQVRQAADAGYCGSRRSANGHGQRFDAASAPIHGRLGAGRDAI